MPIYSEELDGLWLVLQTFDRGALGDRHLELQTEAAFALRDGIIAASQELASFGTRLAHPTSEPAGVGCTDPRRQEATDDHSGRGVRFAFATAVEMQVRAIAGSAGHDCGLSGYRAAALRSPGPPPGLSSRRNCTMKLFRPCGLT